MHSRWFTIALFSVLVCLALIGEACAQTQRSSNTPSDPLEMPGQRRVHVAKNHVRVELVDEQLSPAARMQRMIARSTSKKSSSSALSDHPSLGALQNQLLSDFFNGSHAFMFFPQWMASVSQDQEASFAAPCFQQNHIKLTALTGSTSVRVQFNSSHPRSPLCSDLYLLGDMERLVVHRVDLRNTQFTLEIELSSPSSVEALDLAKQGFQVFLMQDGLLGTLRDVVDSVLLFYQGPWTEPMAFEFLDALMNITYQPRNTGYVDLPSELYQPGDYLATQRFDGSEVMIQYGTGSYSGHSVMVMEIDGVLSVCESTGKNSPNYWPPPYGVICHELRAWMDLAQKADYLVTHMPLAPEYRAKFNQTKGEEFVHSVLGMPYGFHNFAFTFLDTLHDNYPPPFSPEFANIFVSLVDRINNPLANKMFFDALNMRLNTSCTSLDCILEATFAAGYQNLTEVIVIPEQDAWTYSDGKSMVCDSFVVEVWKAGGMFGDLEIQGTEFTPTDLYTLGVFDKTSPRPSICPSSPQDLPNLCQIMGRHVARFPHWNTITPYSHMAEHCPSMPPDYTRTPGC